jgi:hypothetical protein
VQFARNADGSDLYLGEKMVPGDLHTPRPEQFYLSGMTIIIVIATFIQDGVWGEIYVSDELLSRPESAQINMRNATSGTLTRHEICLRRVSFAPDL